MDVEELRNSLNHLCAGRSEPEIGHPAGVGDRQLKDCRRNCYWNQCIKPKYET
ncbi:hypothetical protein DPMN_036054 [Dreissena polymorpha]|uniref:Uncharacterized protein n=1 Tax=Dreissena polymorpha TaxID=45954 RepID=A0A9D4MCZ3_DREPO|nr:hypothetical protein DPMN_036054 [Dreissena polymorpha]